jgi:hypothetical protein
MANHGVVRIRSARESDAASACNAVNEIAAEKPKVGCPVPGRQTDGRVAERGTMTMGTRCRTGEGTTGSPAR